MNERFAHLHAHFKQYVDFEAAEFERFCAHLHVVRLDAKTIWRSEGEISKLFAFVNKGLMRCYLLQGTEERTERFYAAPDWVGDYASFLNQTPSVLNFQALEEVELFTIPFATMEALYDEIPVGKEFSRVISQERLMEAQARINAFLTQSPTERYQKLVADQPDIIHRVPQYYIAQYLGIKAESLSRIRKRLADS